MEITDVFDATVLRVGDAVEKIEGYPFRGTIIGIGAKSDGKILCMVEIESGPNAAGLVYLHPPEVLKKTGSSGYVPGEYD